MMCSVFICILFSSIVVLGESRELLNLQDIGEDYSIPEENFPDMLSGLGWFGGHDVEKLAAPNGHGDHVGEVTNVEYKEIVQDVIALINALKDFGVILAEEIRIIKEIINSKNT